MNDNYLMHHGVLGQKWGVRRYQNYDGSLKISGKLRRAEELRGKASAYRKAARESSAAGDTKAKGKFEAKAVKLANKANRFQEQYEKKYAKTYVKDLNKAYKEYNSAYDNSSKTIINNITNKKLGLDGIQSTANLVNSRLNYDIIKNKALSEIPRNTNFNLELTSSGYKLRDKGQAPSEINAPNLKNIVTDKGKTKQERIANSVSNALKTGLNTADAVKTNTNSDNVSREKTEKQVTNKKVSNISKWTEQTVKQGKDKPNISPAESVIKSVGSAVAAAGTVATIVSAVKGTSSSSIKSDPSKVATVEKGKMSVEQILKVAGAGVTLVGAGISAGSMIYNTINKKND